jgi:MATE family multidrug resistance protein
MDQALLHKTEERAALLTWGAFVEELKKMISLAAPLMLVAMTLYLLQVVSMMMAGHLSALSLSGVSIATSFTNVTGFSLVVKPSRLSFIMCTKSSLIIP